MTTTTPSTSATTDTIVSRRHVLQGLGLVGLAVGSGATGALASGVLRGDGWRSQSLAVEVACLGELWREAVRANPADDADFRAPFIIEGWIYPIGTIKGDGFIPTAEGTIGRWFCTGYVTIDASRAEPHGLTSQSLYFGTITPERVFPPSMLTTHGLEGTSDRNQVAVRAVTGGAGDYQGATGQVSQRVIATNTSLFADGTNDPAPCWRMDFDLRLPR